MRDPYAQPGALVMPKPETIGSGGPLTEFLLYDWLNIDPPVEPWPRTFHKYFQRSGIVRDRQEDCSFTLVEHKPVFLKVQNGSLCLYVKLHAAITGYGHARFTADNTECTGGRTYRMKHQADMFYMRPLLHPYTWDYALMPNDTRERVGHQYLDYTVTVEIQDRAVDLTIDLQRTAEIPWKLEIALDSGGFLETSDSIQGGGAGAWTILKSGEGIYTKGDDVIILKGGMGLHRFAPTTRGTEPPESGKFNLYLTGFTPCKHVLRIECPEKSRHR
jgi:hypothetical protein